MAIPACRLEEQLSDLRSDQVAYKLTIENSGDHAITLFSVEPRVPVGAKLLEITDTSLAEANARRAELLQELNRLLRQHLWVTSADFRKTWVERQKEVWQELFSVTGYLKATFQILTHNWEARMKYEFDSFQFKITSAADARSAYGRWLEQSAGDSAARSLFEAKLEQLEKLESRMDEGERPGLTRIEPKASFTATYVLKFSRRLFEPRKYQIGFDATYGSIDGGPQQSSSAATNLLISPYPVGLSVVAVLSALLGVLIRESLAGTSDPLSALAAQAVTGKLLVGPIVALVFFNAYEYTSLGKGLAMPLSWRSALLVGVLCGMAQDRILASLRALIGA
jgi:hypothetical protein